MISLEPLSIKFLNDYLVLVNSLEVHKMTDPREKFTPFRREKIVKWLLELPEKEDRVDFAILESQSGNFVGEVVLNEIKGVVANLRVAILPQYFDRGYGTIALRKVIHFGFNQLSLKKITLNVYEINPRGIHVYQKLGFEEVSRETEEGLGEIYMELIHEKFIT